VKEVERGKNGVGRIKKRTRIEEREGIEEKGMGLAPLASAASSASAWQKPSTNDLGAEV